MLSLFGGAGIGLLFGVIMGTSTTPTVGIVLGALTAVLAAILGLNDKHFTNAKAVRIGAFGFACVLGAYSGLFVRSHNLLSPSPEALKAEYVQLGFSESQALQLVLYKEFGGTANNSPAISNPHPTRDSMSSLANANELGLKLELPSTQSKQVANQHSSLLFSADINITGCDELKDTDASLPNGEVINNFMLTGGLWENLANQVEKAVDSPYQTPVLLASRNAICLEPELSISAADCDVNQPNNNANVQLVSGMAQPSSVWTNLAHTINETNMPVEKKSHAMALMKSAICHYRNQIN